jgi:hypothetical protein
MFFLSQIYGFLIDPRTKCLLFSFFVASVPVLGLLSSSAELLGSEGGEVYGHAWIHWWRGEAFPDWPNGTNLAVGMSNAPPIDPLGIFVSSVLGGGSFGYNAWIWLSIFLASLGGGILSKRLGGDFFFGALLLAWSPPFLGSLYSGLSEDGGLGFVALAVAYAHGEDRSWWKCGVFLGLACWSGLVLGWLAGMLCLMIAATQKKEGILFWGASFFVMGLMFIPVLLPHLERISGIGHRSGGMEYGQEPLWQINPWKQIDLFSLFSLGRVDLQDAVLRVHPAYLGIGIWCLAVYQQKKKWLLLIFAFVALALSEELRIRGEVTEIFNPFAWIWHQAPFADRFNHHGRAMLIVSVLMVAACASSFRWWKFLLVGEVLLFSPISVVLPTTNAVSSPVLENLRSLPLSGRVVFLPAVGPGVSFQKPLWIQHIHQHPLLLNPNRPDFVMKNPFVRSLMDSSQTSEILSWPETISAVVVESEFLYDKPERFSLFLGPVLFSDSRYSVWVSPSERRENENH